MKKILGLFYDSEGGINVVNSLIESSFGNITCYYSKYSNSEPYADAIRRFNPDVVITQDAFPGIMQAIEESSVPEKIAFMVYDSSESYPSIRMMKLYRDGKGDFHMPFDTLQWPILKEWKNRRDFCYVGRICSDKISREILDIEDIDVYGEPNHRDPLYNYSVFKHHYKRYLDRGDVNIVLNNYKYHILHTHTDCFSLISAEAMMSGTIPVIIAQDGFDLKWTNWLPEGYGLRYDSFAKFYADLDNLKTKDLSQKALKESHWIKAFHNQPNFKAEIGDILS